MEQEDGILNFVCFVFFSQKSQTLLGNLQLGLFKRYMHCRICSMFIQTMLDVIRTKLMINQNDEVMEIAWSTMWNVTGQL